MLAKLQQRAWEAVLYVLSLYYYAFGAVYGYWWTLYTVSVSEVSAAAKWVYNTLFSPSTKSKLETTYDDTKPKVEATVTDVTDKLKSFAASAPPPARIVKKVF